MYKNINLLGLFGNNVSEAYIVSLGKGLFEIRAKDKEGIAKAYFAYERDKTIVILHCFIKKAQKMPRKEIKIARLRMRELRK